MGFLVYNLDLRCEYALHDDLQSLLFPAASGSDEHHHLASCHSSLANILVVEGWLIYPEFLYMFPSIITSHGMPLH